MTDYFTPTMRLYVDELVDWERYLRLLHGTAPDVEAEVGAYRSVLETTAALAGSFERRAREHWGDEAELTADGGAQPPAHIRDAYDQLREAGLVSLPVSSAYDGAALPALLNGMYLEMISRADTSLMTVVGLQAGVAGDIEKYGSDELKAKWLPRFVSGEVQGAMDLTEPKAGSDLGGITTRATDQPDGTRPRGRPEDLHHQRRRGGPSGAGARRRRLRPEQGHHQRAVADPGAAPPSTTAAATASASRGSRRSSASTARPPARWCSRTRAAGGSAPRARASARCST